MKTKEQIQERINDLIEQLRLTTGMDVRQNELFIKIQELKWVLEFEFKPQLSMKEVANLIQPNTPLCEEL
jgi:hypothetical protein